jgi:transposase
VATLSILRTPPTLWAKPLSKYLEKKELTPYLKQLIAQSAVPLKAIECDFAVDSSGFSRGVYQRWNDAKWGKARTLYGNKQPNDVSRQDWVKVHICTGVRTNIVTAVEVTDAHAGDSPYFAPLVSATAANFTLQQVSGDKAYSSGGNLRLVTAHGGTPYIPFKSNAQPTNPTAPDVWTKMYHFFMFNQDTFMAHYHKRSNVETTFSMIKRKFGERLRSKTETAQINEVLVKILCHNIVCLISAIYELGIEPTFWID